MLERCCLLLSANESYQRAADDILVLTGMAVSASTQHRLVHRQTFELSTSDGTVKGISLDGGKVRLRTSNGQPCQWRDYKAVNLHEQCVEAFFHANDALTDWVNQQELGTPVVCLGDGHPGIWALFETIGTSTQRLEVLDWYHLVENLGKLEASPTQLTQLEALLWHGKEDEAIHQIEDWPLDGGGKFIAYLTQHCSRLVNYNYYQSEGIPIGSGAVESSIKQIGRRIKLSGAQWKTDNVPQVLKHRCAYLNGVFSP